ncbi:MAG: FRG domain-containing protein [Bryobacteraceae bacterium]
MIAKKRECQLQDNIKVCANWATITRQFDRLPQPVRGTDEDGDFYRQGWIFRGHRRETYCLRPSIERMFPSSEWAKAEYEILEEFKSKARMHLGPAQIPHAEDKIGWLSVIQHYGAPTRLLDFTYSPYIALYFALRSRDTNESEYAEVWGIDEAALREQVAKTSRTADMEVRQRKGDLPRGGRASLRPEDMTSSLQQVRQEEELWGTLVRNALEPNGIRREYYSRNGFVGVALPPLHNPRLSSQQGLFLFNGAERLPFEESLTRMMQGVGHKWYKRFRVPKEAHGKIEKHLFHLNIHDLSLFPDIEGLAGFVRRKARLRL